MKIVVYPFSTSKNAKDYYDNAENLSHGSYPIATNRFWHGGVHLKTKPDEPIRAIADGRIVAWRLNNTLPEYETPAGMKYPFSSGFVLIGHTFENNKTAGPNVSTNTKKWIYYSLYMHVLHKPELEKKAQLPLFLVTQRKTLAPKGKIYDAVTVLTPAAGHPYNFCKIKLTNSGQEGWVHADAVDVAKNRLLFPLDYVYVTDPAKGLDPSIKLDQVVSCSIPINAGEIIGYGGSVAHQGSISDIVHFEVFTDEATLKDFFSNPTNDVLGWVFLEKQTDLYNLPMSFPTRTKTSFLPTHKMSSVTPVAQDGGSVAPLNQYRFGEGADNGATTYYGAKTVKFSSYADWKKRGWQALAETGKFSKDGFCDQTSKLFSLLDTNRDKTLDAAELSAAKDILRKLAVKHPTEWSSAANEIKYAALKTGEQGLPVLDADSYKKFIDQVKQQQFWESVPGLPPPAAVWHLHPIGFIEHMRAMQCTLTGVPEEDFIKQVQETLRQTTDLLEKRQRHMTAWSVATRDSFKKWFGTDPLLSTADRRNIIKGHIDKMLALTKTRQHKHILRAGFDANQSGGYGSVFAYVWGGDPDHRIYLGSAYLTAPETGTDSRVGTLIHEMSHFSDVANANATTDETYGQPKCEALAVNFPADALVNAESFMYFMEDGFNEI